MRDVKAVGDGRLDTWEAVRMNERSYWGQFLKTGRVEDYLQYRNQIQERNALRNRAKLHESSSFTSSFRAKAQGQDGEQHAGSDQSARDRSEGRTDRGV